MEGEREREKQESKKHFMLLLFNGTFTHKEIVFQNSACFWEMRASVEGALVVVEVLK